MYTTYHFKSATEIDATMIDAIKASFKSKPVIITVEEEQDETAYLLGNPVNKTMLFESILQDKQGERISVNIQKA